MAHLDETRLERLATIDAGTGHSACRGAEGVLGR